MTITCTRCEGSGFLNIEQVPDYVAEPGIKSVLVWIDDNEGHDVQVCDCCGDGETWYGTPGEHYGPNDPIGNNGPYPSNGGLCRCH